MPDQASNSIHDAGLKAHPLLKSSNHQTPLLKGFCETERIWSYEGPAALTVCGYCHISMSYSFQAES